MLVGECVVVCVCDVAGGIMLLLGNIRCVRRQDRNSTLDSNRRCMTSIISIIILHNKRRNLLMNLMYTIIITIIIVIIQIII